MNISKNNNLRVNKRLEDPKLFDNFFKVWRVNDIALQLGVSSSWIYKLVNQRKIPFRKKGKTLFFIPSEILEWVEQGDLE